MLGLNKRENRIFNVCVLGHFALAGCLFVSGLLPSCKEEPEKIHIFELAAVAVPQPNEPVSVKPIAPAPPRPKPKVVPKVVPPPQPKPKTTRPAPPKPTPQRSLPVSKPKTAPPKPPKSISIDQFRKDRKIPNPPPRPERPRAPHIEPIDPKSIKLGGIIISNPSPPASTKVSPNAINQYLSRVKAKLEGIWRKLLENSEISDGGEARLSFRISSRGALIAPRISKSSGNPSLDRLVLEVARRGGIFGPPPGGSLNSDLEIPFQAN